MKSGKTPNVLISVLNWNNATDTIKCVKSLKQLDYPSCTIVVTDNCSIDNSKEQLKKELPSTELIFSNENYGYAGGNQLAWEWGKEKEFELFWIVNNDAEVKPDCLTKLVEAYLQFDNAIYGGISLEPDNETISFAGGFEFDESGTIDFKRINSYTGKRISEVKEKLILKEVGYVNGANMLIPSAIIKKYGYIDTGFFMYGEELDYCFKLRKEHNIPSYIVPGAIVVHNASASFKKSDKLKYIGIYYSTRNWFYFELKYRGKTKLNLLNSQYSIIGFLKAVSRLIFWGEADFLANENDAKSLAFLHVLAEKKGKTFEPNNYL
ncbi:MAG: glycosyltransferase family 2 protein [Bacteroidia bacterium]